MPHGNSIPVQQQHREPHRPSFQILIHKLIQTNLHSLSPIQIIHNVHLHHRHLRTRGLRPRCSCACREAPGRRHLRQHCTSPTHTSPSICAKEEIHIYFRQYYSSSQVAQAVNQGCDYYQSGQQVGSNDYPHRYNNYEGFDFRASGPWQEFPLLRSGPYTGGES